MANDINSVVLVGRLTRDAEIKYTNSGIPLSTFSIAVNGKVKKGDKWIDEASFFDVVFWGKGAEALNPYLEKGKLIGVQGELKQSRWEAEGKSMSKISIKANSIQLFPYSDKKAGEKKTEKPTEPDNSEADFEDEIPF